MTGERYAVVTGGGSGIGRAVAERLSHDGCHVIVVDVNQANAHEVAEQVGGTAIVADLADQVESVIEHTGQLTDSLWALVNSAAFIRKAPLADQTAAMIDDVWRVNLRAPMLLSIALLPSLVAGRGSIVNIASMSGLHAQPGGGMYSPSKAGLIAFTNLCAVEFGAQGVRANAVCPGMVRTPMSERRYLDPEIHEARLGAVPLGRIGTAQDMANAVAYLLSDEASYVSGVALEVDGAICKSLMARFP